MKENKGLTFNHPLNSFILLNGLLIAKDGKCPLFMVVSNI